MPLHAYPKTSRLFTTSLMDADIDQDVALTKAYAANLSPSDLSALTQELRTLIQALPALEDLGTACNRWFGANDEAQEWLESLLQACGSAGEAGDSSEPVLDSNGTELKEGDSVTVIKDLKVKGGNSDLKRGTLVKKIHLIGDPENIECRVDGSTLVLKTMFLKKS